MNSYYYIRFVPVTLGICAASYFYYKSLNKKVNVSTQVTNATQTNKPEQVTRATQTIQITQGSQVIKKDINKTIQDKELDNKVGYSELDLSTVIIDSPILYC